MELKTSIFYLVFCVFIASCGGEKSDGKSGQCDKKLKSNLNGLAVESLLIGSYVPGAPGGEKFIKSIKSAQKICQDIIGQNQQQDGCLIDNIDEKFEYQKTKEKCSKISNITICPQTLADSYKQFEKNYKAFQEKPLRNLLNEQPIAAEKKALLEKCKEIVKDNKHNDQCLFPDASRRYTDASMKNNCSRLSE